MQEQNNTGTGNKGWPVRRGMCLVPDAAEGSVGSALSAFDAFTGFAPEIDAVQPAVETETPASEASHTAGAQYKLFRAATAAPR